MCRGLDVLLEVKNIIKEENMVKNNQIPSSMKNKSYWMVMNIKLGTRICQAFFEEGNFTERH